MEWVYKCTKFNVRHIIRGFGNYFEDEGCTEERKFVELVRRKRWRLRGKGRQNLMGDNWSRLQLPMLCGSDLMVVLVLVVLIEVMMNSVLIRLIWNTTQTRWCWLTGGTGQLVEFIDREFVTSAKKFANFNEFSEIKIIRKNSYKNSLNVML